MADRSSAAKFNKASFAKTNAIRARQKRLQEIAKPENLESAISEFVTRVTAVTGALVKEAMGGADDIPREFRVVRPMVRATIAEALLLALDGQLPLELKADASTDRIPLAVSRKVLRKTWTGVLTANHIEKFGERHCPKCELRLAIGDTVTVPAGGDLAYHRACKPEQPASGSVRVFDVTTAHLEKRPGSLCAHCSAAFKAGDSAAWRMGWKKMLHESCWLELGKPESLAQGASK
jgi:hypothetical protein